MLQFSNNHIRGKTAGANFQGTGNMAAAGLDCIKEFRRKWNIPWCVALRFSENSFDPAALPILGTFVKSHVLRNNNNNFIIIIFF